MVKDTFGKADIWSAMQGVESFRHQFQAQNEEEMEKLMTRAAEEKHHPYHALGSSTTKTQLILA